MINLAVNLASVVFLPFIAHFPSSFGQSPGFVLIICHFKSFMTTPLQVILEISLSEHQNQKLLL